VHVVGFIKKKALTVYLNFQFLLSGTPTQNLRTSSLDKCQDVTSIVSLSLASKTSLASLTNRTIVAATSSEVPRAS
jgi:hypothetical protein